MKYNILLILGIIFIGCEKEVQIDLPEHKSELVLNCLFSLDSVFKVHLSKTVPVLNNYLPRIDDATIQLYENKVLVEELFFDGKIYKSSIIPKINREYYIEVITPEFQNISAFDYIPSKPKLISASFLDNVYTDDEGYEMSQLTIEFIDNPKEKNYYEVIIVAETGENEIPYDTPYYDSTNNDPVLLNEDILAYTPEYLVFSDELFSNNSNYTLKVNYGNLLSFKEEPLELNIYFRHITENYYNYKKRLIIHQYNQNNDIWDGLSEPISMYTNIEGGYGIFAGFSEVKKILQNN